MKLSMWIIANLLESFEPEVHIRRESPRVLRSARLAYATDCVLVQQDGPDCLYLWNEDSIRLPDLSAREGFELLQSLFDSMLQRFLEGGSLSDEGAQHFLEQRGWTEKDSFRVYILDLDGSEDKLQLRRSYRQYFAAIAAVFPWDLSGVLEGRFVLLANDSRMPDDRRRTKLEELLRAAPVKGGVSLSRQGFQLLPKLFEQAEYALQSPKGKKGFLTDYYYLAMDHLIRSLYDPDRCLAACQPDVYRLFCQDEVLYQTLWAYLLQDRSVTRTVQMLFVHKNTLLYRLRRIEESLQYSFSDPYTRSYMRFSFLLLERHAGLEKPPVPAFEMPEG